MSCCEENKKKCENGFTSLSLFGNADDLLYVNEKENFKSIKLISEEEGADIALELSSVDETNQHNFLNSFLGKRIKINISVEE